MNPPGVILLKSLTDIFGLSVQLLFSASENPWVLYSILSYVPENGLSSLMFLYLQYNTCMIPTQYMQLFKNI